MRGSESKLTLAKKTILLKTRKTDLTWWHNTCVFTLILLCGLKLRQLGRGKMENRNRGIVKNLMFYTNTYAKKHKSIFLTTVSYDSGPLLGVIIL